jgi:hypothetical protein
MADKNDKPIVNFVVLQSVEDYVEKSGKLTTLMLPSRAEFAAFCRCSPYPENREKRCRLSTLFRRWPIYQNP